MRYYNVISFYACGVEINLDLQMPCKIVLSKTLKVSFMAPNSSQFILVIVLQGRNHSYHFLGVCSISQLYTNRPVICHNYITTHANSYMQTNQIDTFDGFFCLFTSLYTCKCQTICPSSFLNQTTISY